MLLWHNMKWQTGYCCDRQTCSRAGRSLFFGLWHAFLSEWQDWYNCHQTCYLTREFLGVHGAPYENIIGCGTANEMSISNLFLSLAISLTVLQYRSGGRVCVCISSDFVFRQIWWWLRGNKVTVSYHVVAWKCLGCAHLPVFFSSSLL